MSDANTSDDKINQAQELIERAKPLFAGVDPEIVGSALVDLLALWIAGHVVLDDGRINRTATDKLRNRLIRNHISTLRVLVSINEAEILAELLVS